MKHLQLILPLTDLANPASTAPVLYELRKTYELDLRFINGPAPAPAAVGIAERYEGPYYRFYDNDVQLARVTEIARTCAEDAGNGSTPEDFVRMLQQHRCFDMSPTRACESVEKFVEPQEEGPFDGILGFSEGASVAATLLFRQAMQKGKSPFKFAIFLCGLPPQQWQDKGVFLADETTARIAIPTAHIVASKDPTHRASLALYNICDRDSAGIFDHGKGHIVPWDLRTTQGIAKEIRQVIQRSLGVVDHTNAL
ncbi:MAG: hypothetical protein Q9191_000597 [Dirinaria sp. TL-2023a]